MTRKFTLVMLIVLTMSRAGAQTTVPEGVRTNETQKPGVIALTARLEGQKERLETTDWELLMSLYHQQGKKQQLITAAEKRQGADQAEPVSPVIKHLYAEALLSMGQQSAAISILKQVEKQDQKNPKVLYLLGIAYIRGGDLEEGIKYLEKAAALHHAPAHMELAKWVQDRTKRQFHYRQVILHEGEASALSEKAASALLLELNKATGKNGQVAPTNVIIKGHD